MELLIKRTYRSIKRKKNLFFAKNDYHVPFATRMKYAFKGFTPNEYVWLDLANNDYRDYISDYQRVNSRERNGAYLNLVAWDVLLTDGGFCLIEGNASSGLMMFQQRHDVRNEEIGDIYRSYGLIK